MRKFTLLLIVFLLFWINNSFSAWYKNVWQPYGNPGWTNLNTESWSWPNRWTRCNTDWDAWDPTAVANRNNSSTLIPGNDSEFAVAPSWTLRCLHWDWTGPTVSANYDTWIRYKTSPNIKLSASDSWGSWIETSQFKWDGWGRQNYANWDKTKIPNVEWVHTLYLKATDKAWNSWSWNHVYKLDLSNPSASDIENLIPSNNTNLIAINSKNFRFDVNRHWWSPIASIKYSFENWDKKDNQLPSDTISNSSVFNKNFNIQNVDNDRDINTDSQREYTLKIIKICDTSWRCSANNLTEYNYNVYANNIDKVKTLNDYKKWLLDNWNQVANWEETWNILYVHLKDRYENSIVKVPGIRETVTLGIEYNNTLHLNQLKNSWTDTAIFSNQANFNIWTNLAKIYNSLDWAYETKFRVYAPTYKSTAIDWREFAKWNFNITNIYWRASDFASNIYLNKSVYFQFKPIFYTNISWWITPDWKQWFRENFTQSWTIDIIENWNNWIEGGLYFYKTWTSSDKFNWFWEILETGGISWDIITLPASLTIPFLTSFTENIYTFKTLFKLITWGWRYAEDINDLNLNEYISYKIASAPDNTIYLAWILNKWDDLTFDYLKIQWITNIDTSKQEDIIDNHDYDDIHNLDWEITKASLKRDLRKAAINTVKFISSENETNKITDFRWSNWTEFGNGWKALWDILYYEITDWSNVIVDTLSQVEWKKTIIIKWWNLYIKSNIINRSTSDILWIIILKDDNWNWWKLYIDNSVLRVDAIVYADKSIISYNEVYWEINWDMSLNNMLNQLYIYWSVFSENTIWGSRKIPAVCPFWTESDTSIDCENDAQKYDLNYLRGWYDKKHISIPPSPDPWTDYPVIIKYNSTIQSTPPPLFNK